MAIIYEVKKKRRRSQEPVRALAFINMMQVTEVRVTGGNWGQCAPPLTQVTRTILVDPWGFCIGFESRVTGRILFFSIIFLLCLGFWPLVV